MQTALTYRTNRDLFSNYYLDEHLPETEEWDEVTDEELQQAYDDIKGLWDREKSTAPKRNESQLEEKFIRPMFRKLGIPFEVEESTSRTQRRPDYGFFETEDAARDAFERREEGDFYENATAVADAKRWGRPLDTRGSGEHKRDFENPSYQIHVYLQEVDAAQWAVLTNGQKWRLYYGPTSHRLDSYYEVDLPKILEDGDLEDFKYFYLFFRNEAFIEDAGGDSFLDDVYDESNVFAQELGEDLQDNIYEAIKVLSEGYLQYSRNDLDEEDLGLIHDSSLIYLYRLIFVLYAEAEGRQLLDTDNEIYEEQYSLNALKQEVADELDSADPKYRDWQDNMSDRLNELFSLIDQGSKSQGIPEEDLYIPAYNGGLFRTDPDEDDSPEARFLANHTVGDSYLARVVELLTRSQNGGGKIFVDYSSLDVRHLGSIYEGLLEYQLNVADGPLTLDDGAYASAGEGDNVVVQEGEVYLTTGSGERKSTGSYYTPEYVVEYIVDETLGPLVDDIREDLVGYESYNEGGFAEEFAERIFELKILDPAMGSGHFLTSAVDYLAREIIDAQEKQAAQQGIETVDEKHDINWARRKVAQRCIYGVDLNPLATELAKVSLWLRTLAAEQPLAFLDHHLKTGNSLVGSDIEDVLANGDNGDTGSESGQLTLQQSFDRTRQQAIEHVMDRFQDLLSIDNETLEDAKEMEDVYDEVRDDPLYRNLLAMANVHTAEQFGLGVPGDADERMARALKSDSWTKIEDQDWYKSAQAVAAEEHFFHWELEFPVAFYDETGERKKHAGFDAIIGNPPYLTLGGKQDIGATEEAKKYANLVYSTAEYKINSYALFYEKGVGLSRTGGNLAFIVPRAVLDNHHLKNLRQFLIEETTIQQILTTKYDVFGGAETGRNVIGVVKKKGEKKTDHNIRFLTANTSESFKSRDLSEESIDQTLINEESNYAFTYQEADRKKLVTQIQNEWDQLGAYISVNNGVNTGNAADVLVSDEKETEKHRKFIEGKDVNPYLINWRGLWINYDPSLKDRLDPADLDTRQDRVDFSLRSPEIFDNEKIVIRQTSDSLIGAYDDGALVSKHSTHLLCPKDNLNVSLKFVSAVFNSKFLNYVYQTVIPEDGKTFAEVKAVNVEKLPVPNLANWPSDQQSSLTAENSAKHLSDYTDNGIIPEFIMGKTESQRKKTHDLLVYLVDKITDLKNKRNYLSLSLLDYLSIPRDELPESKAGSTLEDLQMPVAGIADTPLTKTTDEYEGLRIERVSFEDDGGRLLLAVDVSYKVDEDDPRETDRWDRLDESEFETYEAMAFVDLSEAMEALLREFVPVAVEKGGGFAGFRRSAAGTISPLDRLKDLTIPNVDEIQAGLEQYVEVREQANELEKKIKKTDQLINEIIYNIYGLTDEEIETIESEIKKK